IPGLRIRRTARPARSTAARCAAFLLLAAAGTAAFSIAAPAAGRPATGIGTDLTSVRGATGAGAAVASLLSDSAPTAAVPDDFADDAGYSPVVEKGMLVDPDGTCSSPIPLPARFDTACKAHDLGYDLLRYAADRNRPLGSWARRGLDDRLAAGLHASCRGEPVCDAAASVAARAVEANSWRQGYSV